MFTLIKRDKKTLYLFTLIIITYSIPLFFSFMFRGGLLAVWKQGLWVITAYILLYYRDYFDYRYHNYSQYFIISVFILLTLSLYALFINLNVIRVGFAVWVYLSGMPFIIFPYLIRATNKFNYFRWTIILLSVLITGGLIIDHYTGIFNILRLSGGQEFMARKGAINRATFLFESPTALVNYFNVLLLFISIFILYDANRIRNIYYFILYPMFLSAAIFTGSRQVIMTSGCLIILTLIIYIKTAILKSKLTSLFTILIILVLSISQYESIRDLWGIEYRLTERVTNADFEKDTRQDTWQQGIDQFQIANMQYWFMGHGLGYTMNQYALSNEPMHTHYESAVLAIFYESGVIGWIILFWPIYFYFKKLIKTKFTALKLLLIIYLISFIFICFIAPGGIHYTSLMSVHIVGGFIFNYEWLLSKLMNKE